MSNTENKYECNVSNVHIAPYDVDKMEWATPYAVPGAVSLALEQQGEIKKVYADGVCYIMMQNNQGYQGDLEVIRFPDKMLQDIWGFTMGENSKVLTEHADADCIPFALLWQFDGDKNNNFFCLPFCTATRPALSGKTNEEGKTVTNQTVSVTALPLANGVVSSRTTKDTPKAVKDAWFTKVFTEPSDGGAA